jgi:exopolysaccharide production protein ExoQ
MPPFLALALGLGLAAFAYQQDRERRQDLSLALLLPLLWYLTCATRPLGIWLGIWGIPLGAGDGEDGGFIDRYYYLALTLAGIAVLLRRGFNLRDALARSPWLGALLAFMALSVLWSDFTYISFKRYIKVVGSCVMMLVVLTERHPAQSFFALLRYALYLHLPLSIICNKYFRGIAVQYSWEGSDQWWQGIATSKNTLGQVAMLGFVYFLWEVFREWPTKRWRNLHAAYLLMAVWLLKGSEDAVSLTAIVVGGFAAAVFIRLQMLHVAGRPTASFSRLAFRAVMGLASLVYLHGIFHFSEDSLFGKFITTFGRNITLTDRTHIWSGMYHQARDSFFGGVGYGGFWIGRQANIDWNANMTWVLGQGHSGYVDTFLQLGSIGLILLLGLVFSTFRRLVLTSDADFDYKALRIALLLTIVFINITETTFLRGDHHLWVLFMAVCWSVALPEPAAQASAADYLVAPDPTREEVDNPAADGRGDSTRV